MKRKIALLRDKSYFTYKTNFNQKFQFYNQNL